MSITKKIAFNYSSQVVAKIISTILGLLTIGAMARYLGLEQFGQYTTIITYLSFFGLLSDLGLTLVTVQMISKPGVDQKKLLNNLFGLRLVSALVFIGIAPIIIYIFPYESIIRNGSLILSLSFIFIAMSQILVGLFQKNIDTSKVAIAEVVSRIFLFIGVMLAINFKLSLYIILSVIVTSSGINLLLLYFQSRKYIDIKPTFDKKIWKDILKITWPLALTITFNLIYLKSDTLILSLIKTQAEVGIYGASYKVIDVLITLPFMFAGIILPLLTKAWEEKNTEDFKRISQKSLDSMVIIALPLVFGTQIIATPIMELIAGKEFSSSGQALSLLIIACAIIYIQVIFSHIIIAINKQKKVIWAYLLTAFVAIIAYLVLIPKYSYLGAAYGTIIAEGLICSITIYMVYKLTKFLPNLIVTKKTLLASLIMFTTLYLIESSNLLFNVTAGVAIYIFFLYQLKTLKFIEFKKNFLN